MDLKKKNDKKKSKTKIIDSIQFNFINPRGESRLLGLFK